MENGQNGQKSVPEIVKEIEQGALNPKLLSDPLLDACVEYLHFERGESQYVVAAFLKRNRKTIAAHAKRILKVRSEELKVRGVDVYEFAQRLKWHTELVMYEARKDKDWRLYSDTFHKYIERMQSLGVIYKAPDQLELHTLNGEEIAEIKTFILTALEPYPEAKLALASAFRREAEKNNGNGNSE